MDRRWPPPCTYSGKQQFRQLYTEFFNEIGDFYSLFPPAEFFASFSVEDYIEFDQQLANNAFVTRDLFVRDAHLKRILEIRRTNRVDGERAVSRVLPENFSSKVDLMVRGSTTAFIDLKGLNAVVVVNEDIANLMRSFHDAIWGHSKPVRYFASKAK